MRVTSVPGVGVTSVRRVAWWRCLFNSVSERRMETEELVSLRQEGEKQPAVGSQWRGWNNRHLSAAPFLNNTCAFRYCYCKGFGYLILFLFFNTHFSGCVACEIIQEVMEAWECSNTERRLYATERSSVKAQFSWTLAFESWNFFLSIWPFFVFLLWRNFNSTDKIR